MRVHVYLPGYNEKLSWILQHFAEGIERVNPGWVDVRPLDEPAPCDIAVIFGLVKKVYAPTHAKKAILDAHRDRSLLVLESAFVQRGDYWSAGWGGTNGGADFRSAGMPPDRWQLLRAKSQEWRRRKTGPVVVCGQLPRDTNVQHVDHVGWCRNAVASLTRTGERVLFRPHPRIADPGVYGINPEIFDPNKRIATTLKSARSLVTYNSNSGTDAALAGVPVVACDPGSFAWPVASHDLLGVENPRCPGRRDWLCGLGYSQWNLAEMRAGAPWAHLTR